MSQVTPEAVEAFLQPWQEAWLEFADAHRRGDAWPWVVSCMRTRDEMAAARGEPGEKLPVPNKPHLRAFTWAWRACRMLEVDKARQMMLTWLGCGLIVESAMFTPSAREGYQNMTMTDTSEKLGRYVLYVLLNQPLELMLPWVEERGHPPEEWIQVVAAEFGLSMAASTPPRADQPYSFGSEAYLVAKNLTNRYKTTSGPEGVETIYLYPFFDAVERVIEGIPAGHGGPNKWRGATRTGANHDEAWFQLSLADNINSAAKSVGDDGYHRLWTTASLGEDGDAYPLEMIEKAQHQPEWFGGHNGATKKRAADMPEGVEIWRTTMGYTHMRIHHYADPEKRGEAWVRRKVYEEGDVRKNLRELLIQYNAPSGKPFYASFNPERQRLKARPADSDAAQLVMGMDGGRRPATVIALVFPNGRVSVIRELVTPIRESSNVTAHALALRRVLTADPLTRDWARNHTLVLDPSMFDTRGETDDRTSSQVLSELGFFVVAGSQSASVRYESLTNLCLQTVPEDGLPVLQVDPTLAPTFFEALSGACVTAKSAEKTGGTTKEKNHYSHVTEGGEYLATFLEGAGRGIANSSNNSNPLKAHRPRR